MDFLKKNSFALGLGALGVGALALLYFMVFAKIMGEGDMAVAQANLEKIETDMKRFADPAKVKILPTPENQATVKKWKDDYDAALKAGQEFYEKLREKFDEFESGSADDWSGFKGTYTTAIEGERDAYRKAFLEAPPAPPAPDATPPAEGTTAAPTPPPPASREKGEVKEEFPIISKCTKFAAPEDAKRAQKELWIVKEIFAKFTALKIGGLQRIDFPDRDKDREGALDPNSSDSMEYRWIRTKAIIEMPFLQLEPLLTALFESDRVPFRLDSLEVWRRQESVVLEDVLTKVYDGKNAEKAEKELATTPEEPKVMVTLELSALNWVGTPAKSAEKKTGKEGDEVNPEEK
jgi:hypothetical protein